MVDHSGTAPESATPFCQGIKLQFFYCQYLYQTLLIPELSTQVRILLVIYGLVPRHYFLRYYLVQTILLLVGPTTIISVTVICVSGNSQTP